MKQDWKPGTMIYPLPAVLVSCGSTEEEYNVLSDTEEEYGICHQPDD